MRVRRGLDDKQKWNVLGEFGMFVRKEQFRFDSSLLGVKGNDEVRVLPCGSIWSIWGSGDRTAPLTLVWKRRWFSVTGDRQKKPTRLESNTSIYKHRGVDLATNTVRRFIVSMQASCPRSLGLVKTGFIQYLPYFLIHFPSLLRAMCAVPVKHWYRQFAPSRT